MVVKIMIFSRYLFHLQKTSITLEFFRLFPFPLQGSERIHIYNSKCFLLHIHVYIANIFVVYQFIHMSWRVLCKLSQKFCKILYLIVTFGVATLLQLLLVAGVVTAATAIQIFLAELSCLTPNILQVVSKNVVFAHKQPHTYIYTQLNKTFLSKVIGAMLFMYVCTKKPIQNVFKIRNFKIFCHVELCSVFDLSLKTGKKNTKLVKLPYLCDVFGASIGWQIFQDRFRGILKMSFFSKLPLTIYRKNICVCNEENFQNLRLVLNYLTASQRFQSDIISFDFESLQVFEVHTNTYEFMHFMASGLDWAYIYLQFSKYLFF